MSLKDGIDPRFKCEKCGEIQLSQVILPSHFIM